MIQNNPRFPFPTDPLGQRPRGQRDLRHAGRLRGGGHAPRVRPGRGGEHERSRRPRTAWKVSSSYLYLVLSIRTMYQLFVHFDNDLKIINYLLSVRLMY